MTVTEGSKTPAQIAEELAELRKLQHGSINPLIDFGPEADDLRAKLLKAGLGRALNAGSSLDGTIAQKEEQEKEDQEDRADAFQRALDAADEFMDDLDDAIEAAQEEQEQEQTATWDSV